MLKITARFEKLHALNMKIDTFSVSPCHVTFLRLALNSYSASRIQSVPVNNVKPNPIGSSDSLYETFKWISDRVYLVLGYGRYRKTSEQQPIT